MKNSYTLIYRMWLGLFMGIVTGLFGRLINIILYHMFAYSKGFLEIKMMMIMPIVGGLLLGLYRKYSHAENPVGFDVATVKKEIYCIDNYLMKPIYVLWNMLALFISLISGWSVGKQGPVVYLGAAIGSFFAYWKERDIEQIKILIAGGVSGILASTFGAPLFAIAFVIEVILRDRAIKDWSPIIISSVISMLISRGGGATMGSSTFCIYEDSSFFIPNIIFDVDVFVIFGIIIGIAAIIYTKSILYMKRICLGSNKPVIIAILAGIYISFVGYFFPQIFDAHMQVIPHIIGRYSDMFFLVGLLMAKYTITVVSLSAGGVGGVFMPGIYIGACIGKIMGLIVINFGLSVSGGEIYAVMGMMAFFAGFANAPISATLLVVELTSQSEFLIPVLFISVISNVISRLFITQSLYESYLEEHVDI